MKNQLVFAVVALLFASSCDTVGVAYLPKNNPVVARKNNLARLHDQACAGKPKPNCIRYRNELGEGQAILAFLVNGRPKPIQAIGVDENGLDKPAGMLKPREETFIGLDCDDAGTDGWNRRFCRYTFVVYSYSTETLAQLSQAVGSDQLMQRFIDIPHVEEEAESCYAMDIIRYNYVQDDPIAHNPNGDEGRPPCPQHRRGATEVAER